MFSPRVMLRLGLGFVVAWAAIWLPASLANDRKMQWRMRPLEIAGEVPYFIAPGLPELGYRPEDAQLAEWALAAWSRASEGILCFYPAEGSKAVLRIYWSPVSEGLYGQMQTIPVNKKRGGEVYVRPQIDDFESRSREVAELAAADPLFRDTVVYLTLLHEIGHVLGLPHASDADDAMYYGGDVMAYFRNYRNQIESRADIGRVPGLSAKDVSRVRRLYPPTFWNQFKVLEQVERSKAKGSK